MLRVVLVMLCAAVLGAGCSSKDPASEIDDKGVLIKGGSGGVSYTAPEGWVAETPASQMRKDQWRLPGVDGAEDGELAVFFFPGTGGSTESNLERWYGQFKQSDDSQTKDKAAVEKKEVNGLPVTVVYVTGIYLKPKSPMAMGGPVDEFPDYAMLAAVAETASGPWFFKATGPVKTINHWRESFDDFVTTFKIKSN